MASPEFNPGRRKFITKAGEVVMGVVAINEFGPLIPRVQAEEKEPEPYKIPEDPVKVVLEEEIIPKVELPLGTISIAESTGALKLRSEPSSKKGNKTELESLPVGSILEVNKEHAEESLEPKEKDDNTWFGAKDIGTRTQVHTEPKNGYFADIGNHIVLSDEQINALPEPLKKRYLSPIDAQPPKPKSSLESVEDLTDLFTTRTGGGLPKAENALVQAWSDYKVTALDITSNSPLTLLRRMISISAFRASDLNVESLTAGSMLNLQQMFGVGNKPLNIYAQIGEKENNLTIVTGSIDGYFITADVTVDRFGNANTGTIPKMEVQGVALVSWAGLVNAFGAKKAKEIASNVTQFAKNVFDTQNDGSVRFKQDAQNVENAKVVEKLVDSIFLADAGQGGRFVKPPAVDDALHDPNSLSYTKENGQYFATAESLEEGKEPASWVYFKTTEGEGEWVEGVQKALEIEIGDYAVALSLLQDSDETVLQSEIKRAWENTVLVKTESVDGESIQLLAVEQNWLEEAVKHATPLLIGKSSKDGQIVWKKATIAELSAIAGKDIGVKLKSSEKTAVQAKKGEFGAATITYRWNKSQDYFNDTNLLRSYDSQQLNEANSGGMNTLTLAHVLDRVTHPNWVLEMELSSAENTIRSYIEAVIKLFVEKGVTYFNVLNEPWGSDAMVKKFGRKQYANIAMSAAYEARTKINVEREAKGKEPIKIFLGIGHADSQIPGAGTNQLLEILDYLKINNILPDYVDVHGHGKNLTDYAPNPNTLLAYQRYTVSGTNKPVEVVVGEYDLNINDLQGKDRFVVQGRRWYEDLRAMFKSDVRKITFWGAVDDYSMYEVRGEYDSIIPNADALLFVKTSRGLQKKPSYYATTTALFDEFKIMKL